MLQSVKWSINDRCNQRCPYCMLEGYLSSESPFREKLEILDKLHSMKILDIDFFGREPLIDMEIFDIIKYSKTKGYNFNFTFITNGVNLDKFTPMYEIINLGIKKFSVSYDGGYGGRPFNCSLSTIKYYINEGVRVEIALDVHKKNKDYIKEMYTQFKEIGVSGVYLTPISYYGKTNREILKDYAIDNDEFMEVITQIINNKIKVNSYVWFPFGYEIPDVKFPLWFDAEVETKCTAGVNSFYISSSGVAYGCVSVSYCNYEGAHCDFLSTPVEELQEKIKTKSLRMCVPQRTDALL